LYRIEKDITFEAAHILPNHQGLCGRLHGHSYTLTVICESEELEKSGKEAGMIVDTDQIYAAYLKIRHLVDHQVLNESLGMEHTTVEALSKWFYEALEDYLPFMVEVVLHETAKERASYRP